ncbi:MAG: hypothetical protein LC792_04600, partial [Actinobacteria bacterium]|nr:hypothetical protein [Actinomycetota bacterium]
MTEFDIPEGFWQLEKHENPQPISPMAESFYLEALTAGCRHVFAELGMLLDTVEWKAIGGWVYLRAIPYAGDEQAVLDRIGRAVEAVDGDLAGRYLQRWRDEWRSWLLRRRAELGSVDVSVLDDAELDEHVGGVVAFLFAATDVHLLLHGSDALMLGELVFACRDLLGWSEQQALDLVSGSSPASTEPAERLAELAALLDGPRFEAALDRYLEEFGDRAVRYEVIDPTIGERPELVVRLARDQLTRSYDPAAVGARLAARQAEMRATARAMLAERHPGERERFERLLQRAEQFYPVREDNEIWTQSVPLALARRALLEVGRRLVELKALATPDGVFLLRLPEARRALGENADLTDLVTARRAERTAAQTHPAPATYGPPPPTPDLSGLPPAARLVHDAVGWLIDRILPADATGRRQTGPDVEGIPASPGRYTGPARVVRNERDLDKVEPGDVLVCPGTSPAWSIVFPSIGALVTDTGDVVGDEAGGVALAVEQVPPDICRRDAEDHSGGLDAVGAAQA